ncbi:protein of unknown function [Burkholderia multivorans]
MIEIPSSIRGIDQGCGFDKKYEPNACKIGMNKRHMKVVGK